MIYDEYEGIRIDRDIDIIKSGIIMFLIMTMIMFFVVIVCSKVSADEVDEYVTAIFHAEGGFKSSVPFGIMHKNCNWEKFDECERLCRETILNNRIRFRKYGRKAYKDYLSFLASRYAPVNAENDNGTKRFRKKNVVYFLKNPKPIRM